MSYAVPGTPGPGGKGNKGAHIWLDNTTTRIPGRSRGLRARLLAASVIANPVDGISAMSALVAPIRAAYLMRTLSLRRDGVATRAGAAARSGAATAAAAAAAAATSSELYPVTGVHARHGLSHAPLRRAHSNAHIVNVPHPKPRLQLALERNPADIQHRARERRSARGIDVARGRPHHLREMLQHHVRWHGRVSINSLAMAMRQRRECGSTAP